MKEKAKEKKPLNSIALLFFMVAGAVVLTWLIPAGAYDRYESAGRMVVDPASFHFVDAPRLSPFAILLAVPNGMINAASMLFASLLLPIR